jgi:hypothetical protein
MATATTAATWAEMNHLFLVSEFARLKSTLRFQSDDSSPTASDDPPERSTPDGYTAIDRIVELFALSSFERDLLLLCAGVEMDSELASLCAQAHAQSSRPYVTFGLAMSALADPHWSAFTPVRPLRRLRLLDVATTPSLTAAPVRIEERILHYLAGINILEPSLESLFTLVPSPKVVAEEHISVAHQSARILHDTMPPLVHLCGNDPQGQEDVAALAADHFGLQLYALRAEDLPSAGLELDRIATLMERESLLLPAAFLVQCATSALPQPASHLVEKLRMPLFLSSHEPVRLNRAFVRFDVNKPDANQQKALWQKSLGPGASQLDGTLDELSQHFRLSSRMIFNTGSLALANGGEVNPDALWNACRALARPKLEDLAQRLAPSAEWDELVLPLLQTNMLRQLASQVWHRMKVHESWGFSSKGHRGLGISALFCGDSGTGKTLAAEVLAHELGLDLYRIDLASVVSKYIGETERNLKQIFDAAEEGGVLLLFDEADALFGKRGEVKDSHDRYANIEVGYLLQRMETYQGLAILTTNLKSSLDRAFQRRLRFTVTFPFPDAAQREAIWSKVFPSATPTRNLNLKKLSQLNIAGGNIRNIALNAAFLAAHAGTPVEMSHLLDAARLEAHKIERPLAEAEIRGWA